MNYFKKLTFCCSLSILAACSSGGVTTPKVITPITVAKPFDTNPETNSFLTKPKNTEQYQQFSTKPELGSVQLYGKFVDPFNWGPPYFLKNDVFTYQAKDGKLYEFTHLNHALVPDNFDGNKKVNTQQMMQSTDNGGKLFACCSAIPSTSGVAFAMEQGGYYGAWLSPEGEANLFTAGITATPERMQKSGKATFEVWGIRVKNQNIVGSTYEIGKPEHTSYLTVNFNTGKLGGTILGNHDFGDSVIMKDVNVQGNAFAGTATSGHHHGQVEGYFYQGEQNRSRLEGDKIGGVVRFDNQHSLDTAFGGSRIRENSQDTSLDLNPLP